MNPSPYGVIQAVAMLVGAAFVYAACGEPIAKAARWVLLVSAATCSLLIVQYYLRRAASSTVASARRRRDDWIMLGCILVGVAAPLGATFLVFDVVEMGGWFHQSDASVVAGACLMVAGAAILTSTAADWYLITPFVRGVIGPPSCRRAEHRVRFAKWWIVHRTICEFLVYTGLAFTVTIAAAGLTKEIASDDILDVALGSFIGASTALGLVTYLGPRFRDGVKYMQIQSAGLGTWAKGRDVDGRDIEGFVVDVSIEPGIQLRRTPDDAPSFVPLSRASMVQQMGARGPFCGPNECQGWVDKCERARVVTESHRPTPPGSDSPSPDSRTPTPRDKG